MNPYWMIFGIVAVSCLAGVLNTYFKTKAKGESHKDQGELHRRIATLEELVKEKIERRLANLETIVTDRDFDLNRKFSEL